MSTVEDLIKLKDMILAVAEDIPEIVESMNEVSEWDSLGEITSNIETITTLVKQLSLIATYSREVLQDIQFDDEEVIVTVSTIINEKVDLPWLTEGIEQKLFEIGVGMIMKTLQQLIENGMGDIKDLAEKIREKVVAAKK